MTIFYLCLYSPFLADVLDGFYFVLKNLMDSISFSFVLGGFLWRLVAFGFSFLVCFLFSDFLLCVVNFYFFRQWVL